MTIADDYIKRKAAVFLVKCTDATIVGNRIFGPQDEIPPDLFPPDVRTKWPLKTPLDVIKQQFIHPQDKAQQQAARRAAGVAIHSLLAHLLDGKKRASKGALLATVKAAGLKPADIQEGGKLRNLSLIVFKLCKAFTAVNTPNLDTEVPPPELPNNPRADALLLKTVNGTKKTAVAVEFKTVWGLYDTNSRSVSGPTNRQSTVYVKGTPKGLYYPDLYEKRPFIPDQLRLIRTQTNNASAQVARSVLFAPTQKNTAPKSKTALIKKLKENKMKRKAAYAAEIDVCILAPCEYAVIRLYDSKTYPLPTDAKIRDVFLRVQRTSGYVDHVSAPPITFAAS